MVLYTGTWWYGPDRSYPTFCVCVCIVDYVSSPYCWCRAEFVVTPGQQEYNFATSSATASDAFRSRESCTGYTGEGEEFPTAVRYLVLTYAAYVRGWVHLQWCEAFLT